MGSRRLFVARLVPDVWVVLLVGYLCLPLLSRSGYPLAKDMVFTPQQPWGLDAVGLGDRLPRAVPLDALVSLAGIAVDGAVLARVAVPGILLLAGWGAGRAIGSSSLVARIAMATAAVWNPYVTERVALGQWALLAAYAALWWLVAAVPWALREGALRRDLGPVLVWVAVASITPTGGLLAVLLVTAICLASGRARRSWSLILASALIQLPWILPSFVGGAGLGSDADGVAAFAMRAEGAGGVLVAALGLGGIWDASSMPPSREGLLGVLTAAVCLGVLALSLPRLWRCPVVGPGLVISGAAGFVLALWSAVPALQPLLRWIVVEVPGGGILRDAQKWLLPFVILVIVCGGLAVDRIPWRRLAATSLAACALAAGCLPLLLLPDAAPSVWRTVSPVTYPADFDRVQQVLERDRVGGALVVLPWRSYRVFEWGRPVAVYDPASRWFDTDVVGSETLEVDDLEVEGEDARARRIGKIVTAPGPLDSARLRSEGVSDVLIYLDDPQASSIDRSRLVSRFVGERLALYRVSGAGTIPAVEVTFGERVVMAVDFAALVVVVLLFVVSMIDLPRRARVRAGTTRR